MPLLLAGTIPWYDAVFYGLGLQLLITWFYERTGGSLPVIMLLHLSSNVMFAGVFGPLFTGEDRLEYYFLFIVLTWLMVLLFYGADYLNRRAGEEAEIRHFSLG